MSVAWVVTVVNGDSRKTVRVSGRILTESECEDVDWHAEQRYENCIVTKTTGCRIDWIDWPRLGISDDSANTASTYVNTPDSHYVPIGGIETLPSVVGDCHELEHTSIGNNPVNRGICSVVLPPRPVEERQIYYYLRACGVVCNCSNVKGEWNAHDGTNLLIVQAKKKTLSHNCALPELVVYLVSLHQSRLRGNRSDATVSVPIVTNTDPRIWVYIRNNYPRWSVQTEQELSLPRGGLSSGTRLRHCDAIMEGFSGQETFAEAISQGPTQIRGGVLSYSGPQVKI
ncbi:hypothetical protein BGY98DRAFT_936469 [Russula aff. rugulosa BPL654]|nr:hypothetical protein BGY98DRAFT_936469 [Russula aff. rugulosa BPL654]